MEFLQMVIIVLQITSLVAKKKRNKDLELHSDESIENLLYYKDCKHKNKDVSAAPVMLRNTPPPPPREPVCPCPRMCCSMCCDCNAPSPFASRQMAPLQTGAETLQQMAPQPPRGHPMMSPIMAQQPQVVQRAVGKRKKGKTTAKPPDSMGQPPIGGRRDFGFTREHIKSLISHDQDIKKILKDLVSVTMHKVDLVEQVNARRTMQQRTTTKAPVTADQEDDYYMDK